MRRQRLKWRPTLPLSRAPRTASSSRNSWLLPRCNGPELRLVDQHVARRFIRQATALIDVRTDGEGTPPPATLRPLAKALA